MTDLIQQHLQNFILPAHSLFNQSDCFGYAFKNNIFCHSPKLQLYILSHGVSPTLIKEDFCSLLAGVSETFNNNPSTAAVRITCDPRSSNRTTYSCLYLSALTVREFVWKKLKPPHAPFSLQESQTSLV